MTLSIEQLRRCTVAVDLGTSRTRVHLRGAGLVVDQPSVVAIDVRTGGLMAVGGPAERMEGRTPRYIRVARPINAGSVVDIEMAQRMLRAMLGKRLRGSWRRRPTLRMAACVPSDADPLTQRATVETLAGLGARRVELVDTLVAAAVGCGLPVQQAEATMIAVCGASTTQVAVLSMGSVVAAEKAPVGGDSIDQAVVQRIRQQQGVRLRNQLVRPVRLNLGRGGDGPTARDTEVIGRDVATGRARSVRVSADDVQAAIQAPLAALLEAIREVLHACPPDLVGDLVERGMVLTGGSARLPGLDTMIARATGMRVTVAENPDLCPVTGLGAMLEGAVEPVRLDPLAS